MTKPAFNERVQLSVNCHTRSGKPKLAVIHTQEGGGTAASLANYLGNPNAQVSYHWTVDNDRNVVKVVDPTSKSAWSVGNANDRCINICFAGSYASWTTNQWLDNMGNAIEIAAWILVDEAKRQGIDPRTIDWDEIAAGKSGFTDHWGITGGLKIGNHTDCGKNFPWIKYAEYVNKFATEDSSAKPIVDITGIEYVRAANEWLGAKVTPNREETTPDGKGKFVHYENGSVYLNPNNGTCYAIPLEIRAKWEALGWELGILGYPKGAKVDLVDFTKSDGTLVPGGTVQAFEGGTVYEQRGDKSIGYVVQGTVRNLYIQLRYEMGPLGWPQSDEIAFPGGVYQEYDHGRIIWLASSNVAVAVDKSGLPVPLVNAPVATDQPKPVEKGDPSLVGKKLLDFSVQQINANKIKDFGAVGVIHYVSDPRETWMKAKYVTRWYATSLEKAGLINVWNVQYGKGSTSDWRFGYNKGVELARRALEIIKNAGGNPEKDVVFVSIDDNPSQVEYSDLIKPYLQGFASVVGNDRMGVYCNYRTIDWASRDGLGSFYWQHFWSGDGKREVHPLANITQDRIDKDKVDGVGVDINTIRKPYFGQANPLINPV